MLAAVGVEPGVTKCDLLRLRRRVATNIGHARHRPLQSRNIERVRIEIRGHRFGEQRQIRLKDIEPKSAARLEMPDDRLKRRILRGERCEVEEGIEEDADPIETMRKLQFQNVSV